jgi:protein involved in polysaccharide export with SLBB domain
MKQAALATALSLSLSGCIAFRTPSNEYDLGGKQGYMAQRAAQTGHTTATLASVSAQNAARCYISPATSAPLPPAAAIGTTDVPLSAGDLVRVAVAGDEAPSGTYKVNGSGVLALTAGGDLPVTGLSVAEAESDLNRVLADKRIFRRGFAHASLRILDRGPARVVVTGAVFQPGQVVINERAPNETDTVREIAIGDHAIGRTLSIALSHAAGVRPDADLAHITIEHAGLHRAIDLSGILTGENTEDPMLAEGDHVMVPSRHCFQLALARPTPIWARGRHDAEILDRLAERLGAAGGVSAGRRLPAHPAGNRRAGLHVGGGADAVPDAGADPGGAGTSAAKTLRFAAAGDRRPGAGILLRLSLHHRSVERRAALAVHRPVVAGGRHAGRPDLHSGWL